MNEGTMLLLSLIAGLLLGGIFFGGLWWTLAKGLSAKQPALWFLCSFLLRTAVLLAGSYFVACGHWGRFAVCLVGFSIARFFILRLTRTPAELRTRSVREARNAS
jgi:F1F0 ATPase subunit 2